MTNRQYENRVKKLAALESKKHALQVEIDAIKAEVIDGMGGAEIVTTPAVTIRNTIIVGSRFDTTRFKADHAMLYSDYLKESISTRFTYKIA